jgi:hypothetical protein
MKILSTLSEKTVNIHNKSFKIELKKVVKTNVLIRSSDKRAGNYVDNNSLSTVAFVNGKSYITCSYIDCVIEELKNGGYKFFIS